MPKKIFIIACETSGDLHGAHLVDHLKKLSPNISFSGLGGPKMAAAGVSLLEDMTKFSALGLGDVLKQYFRYREVFYRALKEVESLKPDALILIDSPAFNLRFAKKIKKRFPVIYYISPQIWAWAGNRIHTIKRTVSKMLVILPFEKLLYDKAGVDCDFTGHPLLDEIHVSESRENLRKRLGIIDQTSAIGLLAGSRTKEVKRILPEMLACARQLKQLKPNCQFFITYAPNVDENIYHEIVKPFSDLHIQKSNLSMHDLLSALDLSFITSGTATLEAALLKAPFFLFYKTSWSTYFLGKHLIRVPFLGLANLLSEKKIIPEFIQDDIHPETVAHEAKILLETPSLIEEMKNNFEEVRIRLGNKGAGEKAANAVLDFIRK